MAPHLGWTPDLLRLQRRALNFVCFVFFVIFVVKQRLKSCFPIFDVEADAIDFIDSFDRQFVGQLQSEECTRSDKVDRFDSDSR